LTKVQQFAIDGEMIRHVQAAIAVLVAFCVFAILVSPAVPSPPTTMAGKQTAGLFQLNVIAVLLAVLATPALLYMGRLRPILEAHITAHGPDLVDLTSSRLC
jgi:hypothetical protein